MNRFTCPICADKYSTHIPLILENNILRCANNHSFDLAKEGYVNLLPVQNKKSKQPGDSPEMVQARRELLNAGYYECLAQGLYEQLKPTLTPDATVLDLGCGEGYYTRFVHAQTDFTLYGIDIAKTAVRYAAKQHSKGNYAVANAFQLPFADNSMDIVLQVYAYGNANEITRVLKPQGLYIIVSPAAHHLRELKAYIYDSVQEHKPTQAPPGFELKQTVQITETITPQPDARNHLLKMTPFYWSANKAKQQTLQDAPPFDISLHFTIAIYKTLIAD